MKCPNCQLASLVQKNNLHAITCSHCGYEFYLSKLKPEPRFEHKVVEHHGEEML
jgi:Zn ribbon nucleic-acid-binding protein